MIQTEAHLIKKNPPNLLSYSYITEYLNDYFKYRKSLDSTFSYEIWGMELGSKSKTLLRMICKGQRNLTPDLIISFVKNNRLNESQTKHLYLISLFKRSQNQNEKEILYDKLLENLDPKDSLMKDEESLPFSLKKELPLLQVLLAFSDLDRSLENLSELMNLRKEQTSLLLRELKKLGLADLTNNNQWEALSKKFKVSDKKDDDNLAQFYEQTCDEAKVEVRKKNTLKRFRTLFLSMDENSFTEFSEDLEKFINKSKNKYGAKDLLNKSVFKLNFNAYAVTGKNKSTK